MPSTRTPVVRDHKHSPCPVGDGLLKSSKRLQGTSICLSIAAWLVIMPADSAALECMLKAKMLTSLTAHLNIKIIPAAQRRKMRHSLTLGKGGYVELGLTSSGATLLRVMVPGMAHVGSSRSRRLPDCLSTCSTDDNAGHASDAGHASGDEQLAVVVAKPQVAALCTCSVDNDRDGPPRPRQRTRQSSAQPQQVTHVALPMRQETAHHRTQAEAFRALTPPWQGGACYARRQRAPQPSSAGLLL